MTKIPVEDYYIQQDYTAFINVSKFKLERIKLKQKQKIFNKLFSRNVLLIYRIRVLVQAEGWRHTCTVYQPTLLFGRFLHDSHFVVNQNILRSKLGIKLSTMVMHWYSWKMMITYPYDPFMVDPLYLSFRTPRLVSPASFKYWVRLYIKK